MDIKDLNKPQLLLLAILISFVVSIATGITTVTLMEQAPESVTTPITRIVRETVETILPVESKTVENTVIIKEEDLVVDAIAKNQSAYFIISHEVVDENNNPIEVAVGSGFAVSESGILAVDGSLVKDVGVYFVENNGGKFEASFLASDATGFALLQIDAPVSLEDKLDFTVSPSGDLGSLRTGQKLILLGESVSSFIFNGNPNINIATSAFNAGGMVINLDGEVLGIALLNENSFAPISAIEEALATLLTQ